MYPYLLRFLAVVAGDCMLDKDSSTNMDDGPTTSAHIVNLEKPNVYQSVAEEIFFIDDYECVRKIHNGTVSAVKMISEFY